MLGDFLKRYNPMQILNLIFEDHIQFILKNIPSYEGILIRRLFYKLIFKKIGVKSFIFTNVYITHAYNIIAGDYLAVNVGTHLDGRGGIEIGKYCLVGPNVFIGSSNHFVDSRINKPRIFLGHKAKPVKIGSNVWIGANSVICPGVNIGNNSIIGAGSVVVDDVPESVLAAGNPAKIIKGIS